MKHRRNKIMSCLFLLVMAVGLFQMFTGTAQAAAVVTTAEALKTALQSSGDIQLGANITTSEGLSVKGNVSLDLNGYGILMTLNEGYDAVITIPNTSRFNLYDSKPKM